MTETLAETFTRIYRDNAWASQETRSGGGSELARCQRVIKELPRIVAEYEVDALLDAGCGDWNWQRHVDWDCFYIGVDIVPELVGLNCARYGAPHVHFYPASITNGPLPPVDMVMCRTVLFHLSTENVHRALHNFLSIDAAYLLLTTHPHVATNEDITDGQWRRLNMQAPPFSFPEPVELFPDASDDDGYLALWETKAL